MTKLKVASYVHPTSLVTPTGVGMLTLHMTLELARNPEVDFTLLVSAEELGPDSTLPPPHPLHGMKALGLPMSRARREMSWLAFDRPSLDRYLPDGTWIYNSLETYVPARRCRRIVTVHHVETPAPAPLLSSAGMRQRLAAHRLHRAVSTADLVVAQSTFTAQTIMAQHDVAERRMAVVGSGVDDALLDDAPPAALHPSVAAYAPFVISPGAFQLRKGTDYLFAMARELLQRGSPVKIVCPFAVKGTAHFIEEATTLPNVIALDYISREELLDLIRGAVCLLVPSRLEGFGLTCIEAMALGTPVVASDNSALPETLAGAGVLVDPTDAQALASAVEKLRTEPAHRAELIARGRVRARDFTWKRCMERLLGAVRRVEAEKA